MDIKELLAKLILLLRLLDDSESFVDRQKHTRELRTFILENACVIEHVEKKLPEMTSSDAKRRMQKIVDEFYFREFSLSANEDVNKQRRKVLEAKMRCGEWTRGDAWLQLGSWQAVRAGPLHLIPE